MERNEGLCPWCGKPLQAGFVSSRNKLHWEKENGYFTPLALGKGHRGILGRDITEAWACLDCAKVVMNLESPVMGGD